MRVASPQRTATHPLTTAVAILAAAVVVCLLWTAKLPAAPALAWAVLALAAGYAVSGSV